MEAYNMAGFDVW